MMVGFCLFGRVYLALGVNPTSRFLPQRTAPIMTSLTKITKHRNKFFKI